MIDTIANALGSYLEGTLSLDELNHALGAFDWNDTSDDAIRLQDTVGILYLLVTDVSEAIRDEAELRAACQSALMGFGSTAGRS
jgi:hypothetical protein